MLRWVPRVTSRVLPQVGSSPSCHRVQWFREQHTNAAQANALKRFDSQPILQHVKRKVQERNKLQSEVSDDFSSAGDVQRARQVKELESFVAAWDNWEQTRQSLEETLTLLNDPDPAMRALAVEEHGVLTDELSTLLETTFPALLVPASHTAHMSALIELKAGVGGSEAMLFLAEVVQMYIGLASVMSWKAAVLSSNVTEGGGIRDAIMEVKGEKAYDFLRWESGVHRVQRVPATEASGRVHTSTVAVVVLPLSEETDQHSGGNDLFSMDDIKIEVMRARGAGGQHVNKTESAVRLTHIPTGITVSMQDERSQHQNKRRAFQVLRARLMDRRMSQEVIDRRDTRRNLVRSADRSEKIRTYNYAQDRVTDHRLGLSVMNLGSVMEGRGLEGILLALQKKRAEEMLQDVLAES
ncbi:peptide chain release factor 1 [Sparassis latifolia]|uniref:Peptide chain release factor 1 n=1 Tax=Sparassis crispa TaxID=139825 RepID=A0A401GQL9_9APHY|nr:Putative peptide chain release factor 1 [Sparassis crispa]GBE84518.1 Putative peptide chain release factor 1 [Sparassis crispa]